MSSAQPERRPGTVTAAALITIIVHALLAVGALIGAAMGIGALVSPTLQNQVEGNATIGQLAIAGGAAITGLSVLMLAYAVLMILFSASAMRGRNWARIISSVLLALGALGHITSLAQPAEGAAERISGNVLGLVLWGGALLLYWLPPSNRWYAAVTGRVRGGRTMPTPSTQPGTPPT